MKMSVVPPGKNGVSATEHRSALWLGYDIGGSMQHRSVIWRYNDQRSLSKEPRSVRKVSEDRSVI